MCCKNLIDCQLLLRTLSFSVAQGTHVEETLCQLDFSILTHYMKKRNMETTQNSILRTKFYGKMALFPFLNVVTNVDSN